jgi:hypothetical protein
MVLGYILDPFAAPWQKRSCSRLSIVCSYVHLTTLSTVGCKNMVTCVVVWTHPQARSALRLWPQLARWIHRMWDDRLVI